MYKKFKSALTLIFGIAAIGLFQSVNADWQNNDGESSTVGIGQDIVVSLKSNPMSNPEAACLAVTFARSLSGSANVTLFVTLDGVSLADKSVASSRRFKCDTPPSMGGEISLKENLEKFLGGSPEDDEYNMNNMVVCPLCWISRYGEDELPYYGVRSSPAVGKMILDAEKILDF